MTDNHKIRIAVAGLFLLSGIIFLLFALNHRDFKIRDVKIDGNVLTVQYQIINYSFKNYYLEPPAAGVIKAFINDDLLNIECTFPLHTEGIEMSAFSTDEVIALPPFKRVIGTERISVPNDMGGESFNALRISFLVLSRYRESGAFLEKARMDAEIKKYNESIEKYGSRIFANFSVSGKFPGK